MVVMSGCMYIYVWMDSLIPALQGVPQCRAERERVCVFCGKLDDRPPEAGSSWPPRISKNFKVKSNVGDVMLHYSHARKLKPSS